MKPRIIVLLTFRNEMEYLPGYFRNIEGQFDGVIALDDGSTDGSFEFVENQTGVLKVFKKTSSQRHAWNCGQNHRLLVEASWKFKPDWLLGLDADERVETDFGDRIRQFIMLSREQNLLAFSLRCLHPWDSLNQHRVDGIWGHKRIARLFKARYDHKFDSKVLHGQWVPLNSKLAGKYPDLDAIIYHLVMLTPEKRLQRMHKHMKLDPYKRWQPMGYEYLCDETGLKLEPLPDNRGFIS